MTGFVGTTVVALIFHIGGGLALSADSLSQPGTAFYNGDVITLDPKNPLAEAVVVRDGRIMAVGVHEEIRSEIAACPVRIDLGGKTLLPGFTDAHAHVVGLGNAMMQLDLVGTKSFDQIVSMVASEVRRKLPGEWILGRGWDQNDWEEKRFPTHHRISEVSPDNPVFLTRIDGHAAIANEQALRLAGISGEMKDPEGGRIVRDESGIPTGVLLDKAMELVSERIPRPGVDRKKQAILLAQDSCLACGITGVHDAGVDWETISAYRELIREGRLKLRIYAMILGPGDDMERLIRQGPFEDPSGMLSVRAVKLLADGALGSRGAALLEDYKDDPGNRGLLTLSEDEISRITVLALRGKLQVCVHAIGDRANRIVLDAFETALGEYPVADHRLRIEHAQILSPQDLPRLAELGVIASMQPVHCTSDMYWAPARLGEERLAGAYAWRSLLDYSVRVCFGSDFPVETASVIDGIYAAVARMDKSGWPRGGWHPAQRISIPEALRAYSTEAAYARFAEENLGTIEVGKAADFVVLSDNIVETEPEKIPSVRVEKTIVGGEVVFSRD